MSLEVRAGVRGCGSVSSIPSLRPPQRARARHVGWCGEAEVTLRRRCKWTGAGPHLHGRRAATNPDRQSGSPRAFWGRTDSPGALWKAGPAAGGGGPAPGAARGIRAGSRALPVSGGGVRREGGLLGGLRGEPRAGETERDGDGGRARRQVPAPWPRGWGGLPRRPGSRVPSPALRPPPRRLPAPSRGSPAGSGAPGRLEAGALRRPAHRGSGARRRGAGPGLLREAPPPRPLSGGEAAPARSPSAPGFCFPPGVTGPGAGSPEARSGGGTRGEPGGARGGRTSPSGARAAERGAPGRAGCRSPAGPGGARITERPAAAGPAFGLRSRGGAGWMRAACLHLPPWDEGLGTASPLSAALPGAGAALFQQVIIPAPGESRCQVGSGLLVPLTPGAPWMRLLESKKAIWRPDGSPTRYR